MKRTADEKRKTTETEIALSLNLDGSGAREISTGIGFFDHMLELFAAHGGFDLKLSCRGDIAVDGHHSVEDIGIVLGDAIKAALGKKDGIRRYANALIPMDESLVSVALDVSGRPFLVYNVKTEGKVGEFDCELVEEFFRAVATRAGLTLHINLLYGGNNHHRIEAVFKAFARALKSAVEVVGNGIPSSKGVID